MQGHCVSDGGIGRRGRFVARVGRSLDLNGSAMHEPPTSDARCKPPACTHQYCICDSYSAPFQSAPSRESQAGAGICHKIDDHLALSNHQMSWVRVLYQEFHARVLGSGLRESQARRRHRDRCRTLSNWVSGRGLGLSACSKGRSDDQVVMMSVQEWLG
jgi:hypothetical protein